MDLNELLVFAKVVQTGSFTAAARALRMPKSTVSRKVSELEARVGAQLLQRTTRKLRLTEVGQAYYAHCARILEEVEAAEQAVTRMQATPHGLLRVTTPLTFSFIGPTVSAFLERYPEVQLEMVCTDRRVDLVEEGFDLAIRAGPLADSSFVARRLGTLHRVVVASPGYLRAHGAPRSPADLERHAAIVFGAGGKEHAWALQSGTRSAEVAVRARLAVNDYDMLLAVVLAGSGVALVPPLLCTRELQSGRLERLLPDWSAPGNPVHALYPGTRHLAPKVTAFVDYLREQWPERRGGTH